MKTKDLEYPKNKILHLWFRMTIIDRIMPIAFVEKDIHVNKDISISGKDAHHLTRVLRLRVSDWLNISDGKGNLFKGIIKKITSKNVTLDIIEKLPRRPDSGRPTLAIAVVKKRGLENIINKAVELGCKNIIPFYSERSVQILDEKQTRTALNRWNKIAISAAKQSGLPFIPKVEKPISFGDLINTSSGFTSRILLWEGEKSNFLWKIEVSANPLLIVGPEGGFSEAEANLAHDSNFEIATLGKQILRVETAAIAALSIWGQLRGGIN